MSSKKSSSKSSSSKSPSSKSSSSNSTAAKRLIQELSSSARADSSSRNPSIERLGPVSDDDLFHWEAVITGKGLGGGYERGRWLVDIVIPDGNGKKEEGSYPIVPPKVRFVTKICAANVAFETGEVCLDLLKTAWTPAYTIATTIDAIWQMLDSPGVDSPLNVDVAALLREGDSVGAEGLVRWCCGEWKWEGK